jgi:hypothetical protein
MSILLGIILLPGTTMANEDLKKEKNTEVLRKKKSKVSSSRNNSAVKIYPDIFKKVMHVVAKDNVNKDVDFFVFDLQGGLIQHYKMKAGDHEKIEGLERGKYVFHVFVGDEETANGKFEIR